MKTCSRCEVTKPTIEFHRRSASKDGLRSACKACVASEVRTRPNHKEYETKIKRVYGIDLNQYNIMFENQNGSCKICGTEEPGCGRSYFCIDHDHQTGDVRGLLCNDCNVGIARFKDNTDFLQSAINYLS